MYHQNKLPTGYPSIYNEVEVLGTGVDSCVVLAKDTKTDQLVAIKKINKDKLNTKSYDKVVKEIEILQKINNTSKYFLQFYDAFECENTIYIVTEYIKGGELFDLVEQFPIGVPEVLCKKIVKEIFIAINQLHKLDIAHLDLKLENIMYNKDSESIKIIDFGYANYTKEKLSDVNGSIHYIAPQLLHKLSYDGKKADAWSLGVVTYCLLAANFPFDDENNNRRNIFFKIKKGLFSVPQHFSSHALSFIEMLLNPNENSRSSVGEMLSHPFLL